MTSLSPEQLHELSGLLQKAASGQMPVRGQHFEILGKFGSVGEAASAARLLSAAEMPQLPWDTRTAAFRGGSDAALASLGIEKEAFVRAVGAGLAAGARALAPHVGKAIQGVATAGRRLGTGLAQAGRAAQPHLQQAGQQVKTMATNTYNTAKPAVQSAFNKMKGFVGGGGVGDAALNAGVPGAMSAAKQPRMY